MMEVGRICVKTAGRDAGKKCIIIEVLDKNFVMIDGETRRKKCNVKHLEPLDQKLDIVSGISHEDVADVFAGLGVDMRDTKPKNAAERTKKSKAQKKAPAAAESKPAKKEKAQAPKAAEKQSAPAKKEAKVEVRTKSAKKQ